MANFSMGSTSPAVSPVTSTVNRYVSTSGSNTTGNGTSFAPYATITKAVTGTSQFPMTVLLVGNSFNEAITLGSGQSNVNIISEGSIASGITTDLNGAITTTSGFTRLGMKGININSADQPCIAFNANDAGRHRFENCAFTTTASNLLPLSNGFNTWIDFVGCVFSSSPYSTLVLPDLIGKGTIRLLNCGVVNISVGAGWTVYYHGTTLLNHVTNPSSTSVIVDLGTIRLNGVITTQVELNGLISKPDGAYAVNFVSPTGITNCALGDVVIKSGSAVGVIGKFIDMPGVMPVITSTSTQTSYFKNGAKWSAYTSSTTSKNRFHNGALLLATYGTSNTVVAGAGIQHPTVDRFYAYCSGANVLMSQTSSTGAAAKLVTFAGAAGVTGLSFGQRINASNSYDMAGGFATMSLETSCAPLTTVTWTAYYANSVDTFGTLASPTRTQFATGTFTVTGTMTRYAATMSVPSAATTGIEVVFSVGALTSGAWNIRLLQFEKGNVATDNEYVSLADEQYRCRKKARLVNFGSIARAVNTGMVAVFATYDPMDAVPTASIFTSGNIVLDDGSISKTLTSPTIAAETSMNIDGGRIFVTGGSGLTVDKIYSLATVNAILLKAEIV